MMSDAKTPQFIQEHTITQNLPGALRGGMLDSGAWMVEGDPV